MAKTVPYYPSGGESLTGDLHGAATSVEVWMGVKTDRNLLQSLLAALRKGVTGSLFLPLHALGQLELTEQYLENYSEAGGRLYLLTEAPAGNPPTRMVTLIDDDKAWWYDRNAATHRLLRRRDALAQVRRQFAAWRKDALEASSALVAEGLRRLPGLASWQRLRLPLELNFQANTEVVQMGNTVNFNWSVSGADLVEFYPGPRTVNPVGSLSVQPQRGQLYRLVARKDTWTLAKEIFITVARSPELRYWLTARNADGLERPLNAGEDLPNHYAVIQGESITLHWHAQDVDELRLDGKPVAGLVGTREFPVEELLVLQLEANYGEETLTKTITVKSFAPPPAETTPEVEWLSAESSTLPVGTDLPQVPDVSDLLDSLDVETRKKIRKEWRAKSGRNTWWKNLLTLLQKREP